MGRTGRDSSDMAQTRPPTALVTGGTGGLGAAVTRELLDTGWRVVVPWVEQRELERVEQHERLELINADCMDPGQVARATEAAGEDLRAAVNLIGGFAQGGRVHETAVEEFEAQLRLNLRATYLVCAAAIPVLLRAGGGALVCVSSRAALRPFPGAAGYITAKAAVLAFVDALDAEYRKDRIRANAILPSVIDTPANRAAMPDADPSSWVRPEEIARTIGYLCSDESTATSGAHVPVYGRA
jgi:NAD(P)-dependent dehydrogenase (short-subunit alcohol dehydrogenase family)